MANRLYNKQVTPKGYKEGGKVMKAAKEAVKNFRTKKASEAMKRKPTSKSGSSTKDIFKSYGKYDGKPIELKDGGMLKPVNKSKNPGLAKLPTQVRNKMGYMKKGGKVKAKKSKAIHPLDHPDVKMTQKMYAKNKIYAGTKEEVAKNLDKIQNKIAKKRTKTEGSS